MLTFARIPMLAELGFKTSGVDIFIGNESSSIGNNQIWLHGKFQIQSHEAIQINTKDLHKALVITWVSDGVNNTKNLVGDVMLFDDDVSIIGSIHTGYFSYDLTDWLFMHEKRSYYITVSLDKFISNIVEVEVNPIT